MIHKINDSFDYIPDYPEGSNVTSYNCNDGCIMYYITDTSKQSFLEYKATLAATDFMLYSESTIRDNYFATYVSKEMLLHLYYTTHDRVTRIIADPNTNYCYRQKAESVIPTHQTTLYQLELDYRTVNCGMCYIIQCEDGSFFVIDSAHMNSTNDHIRIYQLLRRLTPPEKKIVIAGWFFSHAHQDHICKFMDFIEADFTDCIIEGLYYNFPSLSAPGCERLSDGDIETIREFFALVDKHSEIPRIKLHTGQRFSIRNLDFEVLVTHEDMYPKPLTRFNDTSTVLMMTVDGCRTLFLGDSNVEESTIMVARYGAYLKSDIIQVAHHGFNHSNVGIYFCAEAKVALYPTPISNYEADRTSEANKTVHRISEEIYVGEKGTVELKLPYIPHSAVVYPKEING